MLINKEPPVITRLVNKVNALSLNKTLSVLFNLFKPEFTIVISSTTSRELLSNSRLIVDEDDLMWFEN